MPLTVLPRVSLHSTASPIYIFLDLCYDALVHTKRVAFHPHGSASGGEYRYDEYLTRGARSSGCRSRHLRHHCIRACRISGAEVMRHAALYSTTFCCIITWWGVKRSRCPDIRTGWFCMRSYITRRWSIRRGFHKSRKM